MAGLTETFFFNIDLVKNSILNTKIHPLSTTDRAALGNTLGVGDAGITVFDITLNSLFNWTGSSWITYSSGAIGISNQFSSAQSANFWISGLGRAQKLISDIAPTNPTDVLRLADTTIYQSHGNYITALTGDATASGPNSAVLTLSTVNSNIGSFGSSSLVPTITVNGKGLITSIVTNSIQISESQVTNLISDLAGKQSTLAYIPENQANKVTSFSTINNTLYPTIQAVVNYVSGLGGGTVLSFGFTNANGITGTVLNPTSTPSLTLSLGAITPTSTNGVSAATMAFNDATSSIQTQINSKIGLTSLSATSPIFYDNTTGIVSSQVSNVSQNGYLSSSDWTIFNNKQANLGFTPENVSNKATTLGTLNNTLYPTTQAVAAYILSFGYGTGTVTSVSGTTNRITSTGGATPIIDIASTYIGQNSIITLGTITTGIWNAASLTDTYISSAANWNIAYTNRITSLTTTGSGAATLISNVLNIPTGGSAISGDIIGTNFESLLDKFKSGTIGGQNGFTIVGSPTSATTNGANYVVINAPYATSYILSPRRFGQGKLRTTFYDPTTETPMICWGGQDLTGSSSPCFYIRIGTVSAGSAATAHFGTMSGGILTQLGTFLMPVIVPNQGKQSSEIGNVIEINYTGQTIGKILHIRAWQANTSYPGTDTYSYTFLGTEASVTGDFVTLRTFSSQSTFLSLSYQDNATNLRTKAYFSPYWFNINRGGIMYSCTTAAGNYFDFIVNAATAVSLQIYSDATASTQPVLQISIDDKIHTNWIQSTNTGDNNIVIAGGLDPTRSHHIKVEVRGIQDYDDDLWNTPLGFFIRDIITDGVCSQVVDNRSSILGFGDSITEGLYAYTKLNNTAPVHGAFNHDATICYNKLLGKQLNMQTWIHGYGGSGLSVIAHTNVPIALTNSIYFAANFPHYNIPSPDIIINNLGTNDQGVVTNPDFITAYTAFIVQQQALYPNADIYIMVPFLQYFAVQCATVCSITGAKLLTTSSYAAGLDYADGTTHPSALGHQQIFTSLYPQITPFFPKNFKYKFGSEFIVSGTYSNQINFDFTQSHVWNSQTFKTSVPSLTLLDSGVNSSSLASIQRTAGTANTFSITNYVADPGNPGLAINFGTTGILQASDTGLPSGSNITATIAFWAMLPATGSTAGSLINIGDVAGGHGIQIYNSTGGAVDVVASGTGIVGVNPGIYNTAAWVRIVVVFNGSSNCQLYRNGVLTSGTGTSGTINLIGSNGLNNNLWPFGSNSLPNGSFDQLLIYNTAWTGTLVTADYNSGLGATPPTTGLIRQYDFDGTLNDSNPNTTQYPFIGSGTNTYVTGITPIGFSVANVISSQDGVSTGEKGIVTISESLGRTIIQGALTYLPQLATGLTAPTTSGTTKTLIVDANGLVSFTASGGSSVSSISIASTNGFTGTSSGGTTPILTLLLQNATTSQSGQLISTDWNTFNNKFTLPSLTNHSVLFSNGTTISQDNSNFYYDSSFHGLSINTNGDFTGTNAINIYGAYDAYEPQSAIGTVTNGTITPGISASTSRGTGASPLINNTGDLIGTHSFWAYTGATPAYTYMAGVVGTVTGSSSSNLGGQLDFYVKADGGTQSSAMTIANDKTITLAKYTTNGGLFYGNGSGVIQQSGAITGIIKGNGTSAPTVATAGTDYVLPSSLLNLTATDATLTFSGSYNTTVARTVGLNLANANIWTAAPTVNIANITTTSTDGLVIANNTASVSGTTLQNSPRLRFTGSVWNTTSVATANQFDWKQEARGVSGTTPTSSLFWSSSLVTGTTPSFTDQLQLTSAGQLIAPLGSNTNPTYSFAGNTGTGMYASTSSGRIDFAIGGTNFYRFDNAGNFYILSNNGGNNGGLNFGTGADLTISRIAANEMQIGITQSTTVANSFHGANSSLVSNSAGGNLKIGGGTGTGTAAAGNTIIEYAAPGSSGSALNTRSTAVSVNGGTGQVTINQFATGTAGTDAILVNHGGIIGSITASSVLTNPMTTLGDIIYENATPAPARLAGNTTSVQKFFTQTGTGSISAVPTWFDLFGGTNTFTQTNTFTNNVTISGSTFNIGARGSVNGGLLYGDGANNMTQASSLAYNSGSGGTLKIGDNTTAGYVFSANNTSNLPAQLPFMTTTQRTGYTPSGTTSGGITYDTSIDRFFQLNNGGVWKKILTSDDYASLIVGTPTIVAGTGAGTSPTVSVTSNGRSLQVTVVTGTLPTGTNATVSTITLANSLTYTPYPVFSSGNASTSLLSGASMIYMTSSGSANVTITSGTTALTAATTYVWNISL